MMDTEHELVYGVMNYMDTIRSGIADYHGTPHYFEERFDDVRDDYNGIFDLYPIDRETLEIACEATAIENRFWAKFSAGTVDTPPDLPTVLPEDRVRYCDLQRNLEQRLNSSVPGIQATACFTSHYNPHGWGSVRWTTANDVAHTNVD